jgi:hypothetical protein
LVKTPTKAILVKQPTFRTYGAFVPAYFYLPTLSLSEAKY